MKFNIATRELYTDSGTLIKKLSCPLKMRFSQLDEDAQGRFICESCKAEIVDTAVISDIALLKSIKETPGQCLKVDLNQANLKIIFDEK